MKPPHLPSLALLALALPAPAQSDPAGSLQAALAALRSCDALAGARVGVLARALDDGRTLCEHDADAGFMTASNMKLVTAAVALRTLGPEFRFTTSLVAAGPIANGVLHGDLVLVGQGDPTFGGHGEGDDPAASLGRMVDSMVAAHGITAIRGDVLGDDDCQPDELMGEGWAWGYQGADYAAQVSGLCFAENCATVVVDAGAPGRPPAAALIPATGYLSLALRATTVPPGAPTRLWVERDRASRSIVVGGSVPAGAGPWRERVSVENPTTYAATVLLETLRARGIDVSGVALDRDERPARPERYGDELVLATHRSAPLREIVAALLKVSQNLYAEQLVRAAARQARGSGGMLVASAHAKSVLAELGVDPRGMRIADGSGLSRLNLVQPRQLVALLAALDGDARLREDFVAGLPLAGVDGTLARRFRDTPAAGRVRAKTGYISSVVALSGFVAPTDAAQRGTVFSILVNGFTSPTADVQRAVDSFVVELARATP
ncbi:MAG: D-alanyl-D-alanine carboxypeptidase/D-alanyl-D-alanine-endopeptidase [Planctomycetes bacterium]|nr:D-alanyl-D-alanine carboxypeptidase/D-alanyl-D-alanine-endopeptidase [Planctomycetota bacterium]